MSDLPTTITALYEADHVESVMPRVDALSAIRQAVDRLDTGTGRVAEIIDGEVVVHDWLKQAILLYFRTHLMDTFEVGPFEFQDKVPLKTGYTNAKVRVVPPAVARWGAYLAPGVTLMPSYVNIGAYVDADTMVDTWATVGSCAQIGKRVHLSGGVGIGGVLEPPQAAPVIIEDDVFVGSRSIVVEGARVRAGAKLGAGTIITSSTPVIDAQTGDEISRGDVPERAIVVNATRVKKFPGGSFGLPCALVLRTLAEGEVHDKLLLNDVLREHGIAP